MFPALGKQRPRKRLPASRRGDFFVPGTGSSGRRREQARHPGRLSPTLRLSRPATEGSAPYWARTVTQGPPGLCLRNTAAGAASTFGLPLRPALALPHFRTPHEAPLTGQDASRISEVLRTGIGIHSQVRERWLFVVPGCARLGADPESNSVRCSG